jgi:hypothetical protein
MILFRRCTSKTGRAIFVTFYLLRASCYTTETVLVQMNVAETKNHSVR